MEGGDGCFIGWMDLIWPEEISSLLVMCKGKWYDTMAFFFLSPPFQFQSNESRFWKKLIHSSIIKMGASDSFSSRQQINKPIPYEQRNSAIPMLSIEKVAGITEARNTVQRTHRRGILKAGLEGRHGNSASRVCADVAILCSRGNSYRIRVMFSLRLPKDDGRWERRNWLTGAVH